MMNEQRIADGHPAQSQTPTFATPNTTPSSAYPVSGSNQAEAVSSSTLPEYMTKKRPPTGTVQSLFEIENRGLVDLAIARFFYPNGISFNVAWSPYYGEMVKTIIGPPSGYKPLGFEKLRTTLVDKEKSRVEEEMAPLKHAWSIDGCSIMMDGWTDIRNRPLLNIIVSSTSGLYFLKAIGCSGKEKNTFFFRDALSDAIEVRLSNVVQVIIDVAPVCKATGLLVQKKYKHIFWTPCCVHALNNALKDIGKFDWIVALIEKGRKIQMFICNHHRTQAWYRKFSKLELLKPTDTQFSTYYILLDRLL
eukprot:Gb_13996 [translate_table: standard]